MIKANQHPAYSSYQSMKTRCHNPNYKSYHRYGGRGIKVCYRWLTSFWLFLEDMGEKPTPEHQIDRIDSNGDYTPENCRWVLPKEQQNNRSSNVILEFRGKSQTMQQWCDELGLSKALVRTRLFEYGLSIEEALTRPLRAHLANLRDDISRSGAKPLTVNGETHTLNEWARRIGISRTTLSGRIKRWGAEMAVSGNMPSNSLHRKSAKPITFNGETHTRTEWARILGISYPALWKSVRRYGEQGAIQLHFIKAGAK